MGLLELVEPQEGRRRERAFQIFAEYIHGQGTVDMLEAGTEEDRLG